MPKETDRESEEHHTRSPLHGISRQTYPPDVDGFHHRRYEWSALGSDWWFELNISKRHAEYYRARSGHSRNYAMYVSDPYGDEYVEFIADEFERLGSEYDLSDREVADLATAFVQQLRYTTDAVSTGFGQYTYYPVETLLERGGDCEDSTVLLAAILREMGYGCVLLGQWEAGHMALGVMGDPSLSGVYYEHDGERYYYVETTGEGYSVGEVPSFAENAAAEIIEIHSDPTLVYAWETTTSTGADRSEEVIVRMAVRNVGGAPARNAVFYAEIEDRSERVYSEAKTPVGLLQRDDTVTETAVLQAPPGETVRVNTAVFVDGAVHDTDQSEWRRPE